MKARPASFVWTDPHGNGRCAHALFRRVLRLRAAPRTAALHIFADTRYRLTLNGVLLGYGPARFIPGAPEHDTYDLAHLLQPGTNVLVAEVVSWQTTSYEAAPSRAGFVAWGSVDQPGRAAGIDLATPGAWQCRVLDARDAWAPPTSFAQGPAEILDLARFPDELLTSTADAGWSAPVPAAQDAWGPLTPRSIPMLTRNELDAERVLASGPLAAAEERFGFRVDSDERGEGRRVAYATHIHSPIDQEIILGAFWGPHFLNGHELTPVKNPRLGNREDFPARLRAGWNFLYGEPEALERCWGLVLGLPAGRDLTLAAEAREGCRDAFLVCGPLSRSELQDGKGAGAPDSAAALPEFAKPWIRVPHARPGLPARELAWDEFAQPPRPATLETRNLTLPPGGCNGSAAVYDLGIVWLGHPFVDITAPAGTIVDVGNAELLRPDGMIEQFGFHWGVSNTDRFVCRGGRQRFEAFHHRGGRYLQVCVRDAGATVTLHRVGVRETVQPVETTGAFESPDPVFNWSVRAGWATLRPTMGDAFVDPMRERGVYIGDTLVEFHAARAQFADTSLTRRCLALWAQSQRADGQMMDVVPAWKDQVLTDYSLIYVLILRDYWAATGDTAFVRSVWHTVDRIFHSPLWVESSSGLWSADGHGIFGDWGIDPEGRVGASCLLNAFRVGARHAAAELAAALGRPAEAARHRRDAGRAARGVRTLWRDKAGRFAANATAPATVRNLHGNVLALLFGIPTAAQRARLLPWVLGQLETNHELPRGHLELYFLYYTCEMLYDLGRVAEAEAVLRAHYGRIQHPRADVQLGQFAPILPGPSLTLWETLNRHGSQTHGWACTPQHIFATRTLGVRIARPGKPDEILVAPDSATLAWARGCVPHRRGVIHVSWERDARHLHLRVRVPPGVRARLAPGRSFRGLHHHLDLS